MNIFSNNCVSGYAHKDICNEKLNHPLYWTHSIEQDFVNFVKYYDEIELPVSIEKNLIKYEDTKCAKRKDIYYWTDKNKNKKTNIPSIKIDHDIEILFPNHINNLNEMWNKRLSRFDKSEKSIFILYTFYYNTDESIINDFISINKHNKVLITPNRKFTDKLNRGDLIVFNSRTYPSCLTNIYEKIKEFYKYR